jgi:resuscitation-promoting factor RpfA
MEKSPDAFRTISEVAEFLETPAHVLRFWESRFPQIRPVKRAGGRRYYRPADVALLTGIKRLLHDEGMTIRGVQKILREQGVRFVSGVADESSDADQDATLAAALAAVLPATAEPEPPAVSASAQIIALPSVPSEATAQEQPVEAETPEVEDLIAAVVSQDQTPAPDIMPAMTPPEVVQSDLFADLPVAAAPPRPTATSVSVWPPATAAAPQESPSLPEEEVAEAPMEVWADPDEHAPEPLPDAASVTSLPMAPTAATLHEEATVDGGQEIQPEHDLHMKDALVATPQDGPAPPPGFESGLRPDPQPATAPRRDETPIAQRLRALHADEIDSESRETIDLVLGHALGLRARLARPFKPEP